MIRDSKVSIMSRSGYGIVTVGNMLDRVYDVETRSLRVEGTY